MILKTNINVTCSENSKATPHIGIVIGKILSVGIVDFSTFNINFQYEKEDGTYLMSGNKIYTKEEINNFYELVSDNLPESIDWTTDRENEFYTAFKFEMADTFSIEINEIETI